MQGAIAHYLFQKKKNPFDAWLKHEYSEVRREWKLKADGIVILGNDRKLKVECNWLRW